jgi:very-short-patch-repair endonuclease
MLRLLRENFPRARFRWQVPIRHYFADFASHRARLIVEVDGGQHSEEVDAVRTAHIEAEGYRIVRFWNHDVLENGEGCMESLAEHLAASSPPSSSD